MIATEMIDFEVAPMGFETLFKLTLFGTFKDFEVAPMGFETAPLSTIRF